MRLALTWIQPDDLDLAVEADDCFVFLCLVLFVTECLKLNEVPIFQCSHVTFLKTVLVAISMQYVFVLSDAVSIDYMCIQTPFGIALSLRCPR